MAAGLTVFTMLTGDKYPVEYAQKLARGVARFLTVPHEFVVISDREIEGLRTLPCPEPSWEGWWQKVALFKPGFTWTPRNMFIDVDSIILRSLNHLPGLEGDLLMFRDWRDISAYNSSLIIWTAGTCPDIYERFDYQRDAPGYFGDQNWISAVAWGRIRPIDHREVASYRMTPSKSPDNATIITFDNQPKPHMIDSDWVRELWAAQ
jgi:hypothetical protein